MRVKLINWEIDYVSSLAEAANNKEVSRYLRDVFPYPYTLENAKEFIEFCVGYKGNNLCYAIEADGNIVGGASIEFRDDVNKRTVGIGYWIGQDAWGKGIGTQVVKMLCDKAFENNEIVRVDADVISENIASKRVLEKAGFELEGTLKKAFYKNGEFFDGQTYAIVR